MRPLVKVRSFSSYDAPVEMVTAFPANTSSFAKREMPSSSPNYRGQESSREYGRRHLTTLRWNSFLMANDFADRLPFREIFERFRSPFFGPLTGSGGGGFYSYVPLPFQRSCKIRLRGPKMQFFQINYGLYEPGTKIATIDPAETTVPQDIGKIGEAWKSISAVVVPKESHRELKEQTLEGGKSVILFNSEQPGRVVAIRLSPASAFAGPDRSLVLKASWDGASNPAVLVPVGDFFGYSFGDPSARSLLVGVDNDTAYAYFPMPYDHSARIEIESERQSGPPVKFTSEIFNSVGRQETKADFTRAGTARTRFRTESPLVRRCRGPRTPGWRNSAGTGPRIRADSVF